MMHPFPAVSPFLELAKRVKQEPEGTILRDHLTRRSITARDLLYYVARLRRTIWSELLKTDDGSQVDLRGRFIFIVAPPGVEYIVSMLAILSCGAAISPQSIVINPKDMKSYIELARPVAVLFSPNMTTRMEAIKTECLEEQHGQNYNIAFIQVDTNNLSGLVYDNYDIAETTEDSYGSPGSLFFTSGTSGKKKGVIHSYGALLASARERIGAWNLGRHDVVLNQKPANWMGGIFGILPSLMSGACLETCADVFNPEFFWQRIKQGGVTIFDIAPTGYDRLAEYYDQNIAILPDTEKEVYLRNLIEVRVAGVSGSLLPPHTQERWTSLRRGKPLLNLYGSTEVTLICSMRWQSPEYTDMCSVGEPVAGVQVKLVDGELRLKAPTMFTRYISEDSTLNEKAFDAEGFFRTGDCAARMGNSYKIHGRENIDVFHFWGMTLHAGEIEDALYSLRYISLAVVLPLQDQNGQNRAAAILKLKPSALQERPSLEKLREDITDKTGLMEFKQPTVLYWLREGEDVPLTANGKISKMHAQERYFGQDWLINDQVQILDLRAMEYWRMGGQC